MIDIQFKKCCENCPEIIVNDEMMIMQNCMGESATMVVIRCAHQIVCAEYKNQPEDMRIAKP